MTKSFAYLRVSSEGQREGDGFARQEKTIRNYAKHNEFKITTVFKEVVTGCAHPLQRPVFIEMLEALLSNGVRTVLVENLSRLARDLMIQETIIADFQKRGMTLISVEEPDLCSADPSRKLMRSIMGAFNEYEKTMIVLKLRGSRVRKKALTGKPVEGNKEYGFYPGEADGLKRMMESIKKPKYTANRIATELNEDGVKTRSGGIWYGSNVLAILRRNGVKK